MQLRRALPLTLAALAMATGCVTVNPAAPPDSPRLGPAAVRTEPRRPTPPAWPLGRLPGASVSVEPAGPAAVPEPPASPASPAAPRPPHRAGPGRPYAPSKPHRRTSSKPKARAKAKPKAARVKAKAPAKARPRPAQGGAYDMTSWCEAGRGTVSPSILALCR